MKVHCEDFEYPIPIEGLVSGDVSLKDLSTTVGSLRSKSAHCGIKPVLVLTHTLVTEGVNVSSLLVQMERYRDYELFSKVILRLHDKTGTQQGVLQVKHTKKNRLKRVVNSNKDIGSQSRPDSTSHLEEKFVECDVAYAKHIINEQTLQQQEHTSSSDKNKGSTTHKFLDRFGEDCQILIASNKCTEKNLKSDILGICDTAKSAVVIQIGNETDGEEAFVSYVSKIDCVRIIKGLDSSSQIIKTYVLPKLCPMFETSDNQSASAMSMVLLILHVYLAVFDWIRASCVPYLSYFLRFFGQGSGRLVFVHQQPMIWAQHLVHDAMMMNEGWFGLSEYYYKNSFNTLNRGSFYTYGWSTRPSTIVHYWQSLSEWNWNSPTSIFTYMFLVAFLLFIIQFQFLLGGPLSYIARVLDITFTYSFGWYKIMAYIVAWTGIPTIMFLFGLIIQRLFVFLDPVYYHNRIKLTILADSSNKGKKVGLLKKGTYLRSYSNIIYTVLISGTFATLILLLPLVVIIGKTIQLVVYLTGGRKRIQRNNIDNTMVVESNLVEDSEEMVTASQNESEGESDPPPGLNEL